MSRVDKKRNIPTPRSKIKIEKSLKFNSTLKPTYQDNPLKDSNFEAVKDNPLVIFANPKDEKIVLNIGKKNRAATLR